MARRTMLTAAAFPCAVLFGLLLVSCVDAFLVARPNYDSGGVILRHRTPSSLVVRPFSPYAGKDDDDDNDHHINGFSPFHDRPNKDKNMSSSRSSRFASGDQLQQLRDQVKELQEKLRWSVIVGDSEEVTRLRDVIDEKEYRDPERVYAKAARKLATATTRGEQDNGAEENSSAEAMEQCKREMDLARGFLPRFQMEGLWVAQFGGDDQQGYEVINVTYSGDTMVAHVVTNEGTIGPRGTVAFRIHVGVNPETGQDELKPIEVFSVAARNKWGLEKLQRFKGVGYHDGGKDYVDGQLVLLRDSFRLLWLPIRQHALFSRPSPELALRLLRNTMSEQDELQNRKDHIQRCFHLDMSTFVDRQQDCNKESEPFRRIMRVEEQEASQEAHTGDTESNDDDNEWK